MSLEQLVEIEKKYEKLIENIRERRREVIRQINYKVKDTYPYQKLVPNEIKLAKRIYEVLLESVGEKYE